MDINSLVIGFGSGIIAQKLFNLTDAIKKGFNQYQASKKKNKGHIGDGKCTNIYSHNINLLNNDDHCKWCNKTTTQIKDMEIKQ